MQDNRTGVLLHSSSCRMRYTTCSSMRAELEIQFLKLAGESSHMKLLHRLCNHQPSASQKNPVHEEQCITYFAAGVLPCSL